MKMILMDFLRFLIELSDNLANLVFGKDDRTEFEKIFSGLSENQKEELLEILERKPSWE